MAFMDKTKTADQPVPRGRWIANAKRRRDAVPNRHVGPGPTVAGPERIAAPVLNVDADFAEKVGAPAGIQVDQIIQPAHGPSLMRTAVGVGLVALTTHVGVGTGHQRAERKVVAAVVRVAIPDQMMIPLVDVKRVAAISGQLADGIGMLTFRDRDVARPIGHVHQRKPEVFAGDVAHPRIFRVLEFNRPPAVVLVVI